MQCGFQSGSSLKCTFLVKSRRPEARFVSQDRRRGHWFDTSVPLARHLGASADVFSVSHISETRMDYGTGRKRSAFRHGVRMPGLKRVLKKAAVVRKRDLSG